MNTTSATNKAEALANNAHIKELYGLLRENGKETAGLDVLLNTVNTMEGAIKNAESRMAALQAELNKVKDIQAHPVKYMLQNTNDTIKKQIDSMKACVTRVKNNIIEGCKKAVTSCKEMGIRALDKLASFFSVKPLLQSISNRAQTCMKQCDKNISRMETFSKEYHETGLHLKNMGRMLIGKDPIDKPKEIGKLANAVCNSYRKEKGIFGGIRNMADKAISRLEQLENTAGTMRERKAEAKQSGTKAPVLLMTKLAENKDRIRQHDQTRPAPGLAKAEAAL